MVWISRCWFSVAASSSSLISRERFWVSKFWRSISTRVLVSISLRILRRISISSVNFVRPSASNALSGLKNSRGVWSKPVSETVSSSSPFLVKSSVTACCTFWTNWVRCSCNSFMVSSAATERSASTNLPSISSFSSCGAMVRRPRVWAAAEIASRFGATRT